MGLPTKFHRHAGALSARLGTPPLDRPVPVTHGPLRPRSGGAFFWLLLQVGGFNNPLTVIAERISHTPCFLSDDKDVT